MPSTYIQHKNIYNYLMKYIFRFTILNYYSDQANGVSEKELVTTLKQAKFPDINKYQSLIQVSRQCIDKLKQKLAKLNQEKTLAIFNKYFSSYQHADAEELAQVWENEKYRVEAKIIADSTGSCQRFSNIKWRLNNRISSKSGNNQEKTANIHLSTIGNTHKQNKRVFQLDKHSLSKLYGSLNGASDFLDENLQ